MIMWKNALFGKKILTHGNTWDGQGHLYQQEFILL